MQNPISPTTVKTISRLLAGYPQVVACYAFGSRISGNNRPDSDLDIGVLCFDKQGHSPINIGEALQKLIGDFRVDVILLDLSDYPLILSKVLSGIVLYQKTLRDRAEIERRILHSLEDERHYQQIRRHYLNQSFTKGVYAH